jgi:hypothetical protein
MHIIVLGESSVSGSGFSFLFWERVPGAQLQLGCRLYGVEMANLRVSIRDVMDGGR